ncbi:hypothetical protein GCM10022224_037700 [Nonomuraea antimicrobica]|uniref:Uncharacterized protein n=1 Tax=Nonomuraea antimicrobica TaxID=561173 RepID=A0ABP7BUG0_9ACTN
MGAQDVGAQDVEAQDVGGQDGVGSAGGSVGGSEGDSVGAIHSKPSGRVGQLAPVVPSPTMMMSFHAQLLTNTESRYLYRVIIEGGARCAFLVLDTENGEIFSSNVDGETFGNMSLSLEEGETRPVTDSEGSAETSEMSRWEFALVSSNIRRGWVKEGTPPTKVTKYYG